MKTKALITTGLLLFVAISVVALIAKQTSDAPSAGTSKEMAAADHLPDDRLIVYYFHGDVRCPTCITLEEYAKEVVESYYAEELQSGRVQWQIVNFDEPRNEHFLTDYNLGFQALVLVEMKDGKESGYKDLNDIWELVDAKAEYFEYVKSEIDSVLARI